MEVNGYVLHYPYGKTAISLLVGTLMLGGAILFRIEWVAGWSPHGQEWCIA